MGIFDKKNNSKDEPKKTAKSATNDASTPAASMKDLYQDQETAVKTTGNAKKAKPSSAYRILLKPLITEKAANQNAIQKYHFEVSLDSNKIEVAKAVEAVYGVKPISVNVSKIMGKIVRRGRTTGRRKDWKKAIVTLPKGKTIQIYEGV